MSLEPINSEPLSSFWHLPNSFNFQPDGILNIGYSAGSLNPFDVKGAIASALQSNIASALQSNIASPFLHNNQTENDFTQFLLSNQPFAEIPPNQSASTNDSLTGTGSEIVFIDPTVQGYQSLIDSVKPGAEIVILDATRNEVGQITEVLAGRQNISSLHILSHGSSGTLQLGDTQLNFASLSLVQQWANALTPDADILLYGCNVAAGKEGVAFVQQLSTLTGADVAASNNLTGSAALGGDWKLEVAIGKVESDLAFQKQDFATYNGVLATFTVNNTSDAPDANPGDGIAQTAGGVTTLRAAIQEANALAGNDIIILPGGAYTLSIAPDATPDDAADGDLDIANNGSLAIAGASAATTVINANSSDRVFHVLANANLDLSNVTIRNGRSTAASTSGGGGGGIRIESGTSTVNINNSILFSNTTTGVGSRGGGIYMLGGTLNVTNSNLSGNGATNASGTGGGICIDAGTLSITNSTLFSNGSTQGGGGIRVNGGIVSINNSTLSSNQSGAASGGGISIASAATVTVTNSTFSGNQANNSTGSGGGINFQSGTLNISNSTFSLNSAGTGGGIRQSGGTLNVGNTIIAGNTATTSPDVNGTLNSLNYNLIQNTSGATITGTTTNNITGVSANLGSLANNGGLTQTHALLSGSPAIDAGNNTGAPTTDQRGMPRPAGGTVDIGAYEVDYNLAPVLSAGTSTLPAINEDEPILSNTGMLVSDLIAGLATDVNSDPLGIAVTGVDNSNGTWQYSTDGGTSWIDFNSATSNTNATVLGWTSIYSGYVPGTPDSQGWLAFDTTPPPFVGGTQTAGGGLTNLVSLDPTPAGYSNYQSATPTLVNPSFPVLNRTQGFTVRFDAKINSEIHSSDDNSDGIIDRSGFSVIAISSDYTKAIELSFWENEVWAKKAGPWVVPVPNPARELFTHKLDEHAVFSTTPLTRYELTILNDTYTLKANGTQILSGLLRDYSAFQQGPLPYDPYEQPNFLFFGDNTSSGAANIDLQQIALQTPTRIRFVPKPDYSGTANITFLAWDTTNGLRNGQTGVDTSVNGEQTAFSGTSRTATITINPINDAPQFTSGSNVTVNEDAGAQTINNWATNIRPGPATATDETSQTLTFTPTVTGTTGNLSFTSAPTIDPVTGNLTFTAAPNTSGTATVSLVLTDNGSGTAPNVNTSAPQTFTITVNPVNDAPINTVPGAQNTSQNTALVFSAGNGNPISISDADAGTNPVQVTLTATNGTLTLAGTTNLTVTGDGTANVSITGSISDINTALNGMSFSPTNSFNGSAIVSINTNDQGNTGGAAQSDVDAIAITVEPPALSVVINEVAWMGTQASTFDEWIELYNPTANAIDLAGWTLNGDNINKALSGIIPAGGYFLLERTDDNTISDINADLFYTGALLNEGETLTLKGNTGNIIDTANSNGGVWPAGVNLSANARFTMERISATAPDTDTNWRTNDGVTRSGTDVGSNLIYGTPRAANSLGDIPSLSINDVTVTEGNAGTTNATFTVTLSSAYYQDVTVNYATNPGTAAASNDYTTINTTSLTFAPGETIKTVTVQVQGDTLDEPDETFTVNLSNPTNATIKDNQGVGTITDDDAAPTISITDVIVTEGNGGTSKAKGSSIANFTVTLNAASGQDITVDYFTANGTATSPDDYNATKGTLTFKAGETNATLSVPVVGDTLDEIDESFFLNLANPTNATLLDNQGIGTITDDDTAPTISISDVSLTEGNSGTTNAVFTVTLNAASSQIITVDYVTADNNATAPDDYNAITTTPLTFNPGETTKTITVQVKGDTLDEIDENFFVNLSNATNATITDNQGIGTITDDDGTPTISVTDVSVTEGNSGTTNAVFTVNLSNASTQSVSVDYATANGSGTAPDDYNAITTTTLTFAPGETAKTITVQVQGDTLDETDETFSVNLVNSTNATITDNQGIGTITDDDTTPTISITDVTVTEGNSGTTNAVFTVSLSAASTQVITVDYATANNSATTPDDYTALSTTTLTFNPGETTKTISVTVVGDTVDENDESFFVNLSNPTNVAIADNQGRGTINDDDITPTPPPNPPSPSSPPNLPIPPNPPIIPTPSNPPVPSDSSSRSNNQTGNTPDIGTNQSFFNFIQYAQVVASLGRNLTTLFFDENYYRVYNPDVDAAVRRGIFRNGYEHFLQFGDAENRNPSAGFNNHTYLANNSDVAAAVSRGIFRSGFAHFVQFGLFEKRDDNTLLFDEGFYLARNFDVKVAVSQGVFTTGYEHFMQFGRFEGRTPNILLNHPVYLAQNQDVAAAVGEGVFRSGVDHFIQFGVRENRNLSSLFSNIIYLNQNQDVAQAVVDGIFRSGFEHYIHCGVNEGRAPKVALFDNHFYLSKNLDVAGAVNQEIFKTGFDHFLPFGQREERAPSLLFNNRVYLAQNQDVAQAVAEGYFRSGFDHLILFGRAEGRAA